MARTGRPPKPTEQKRRTGTLRSDRPGGTAGPLAVVPAVQLEPMEMDPHGALIAVLDTGSPWLAVTDAPKLSLLRETLEERAEVRALVMAGAGKELRTALRELDKQIQSLLSELGFDPTSRARLGLAEVAARSKLAEIRGR